MWFGLVCHGPVGWYSILVIGSDMNTLILFPRQPLTTNLGHWDVNHLHWTATICTVDVNHLHWISTICTGDVNHLHWMSTICTGDVNDLHC